MVEPQKQMTEHKVNLKVKLAREFLYNSDKSSDDIEKMINENTTTEVFMRKTVKKDNNWTIGTFKDFSFGANSITGFRLDQEDRYTCLASPNFIKDWSYFGLYDGHGGAVVSEYLKRKLHEHIMEHFEKLGDIKAALHQGFLACDQALRAMKEDEFIEIRDDTMKEFTGSAYQPSTTGVALWISDDFYAEIKNQFLQYVRIIQTDLNKASTSLEKESAEKSDESGVRRSKSTSLENESTEKSDESGVRRSKFTSLEKESTEKSDEPGVRRSKRVKKEKAACSSSHSDKTEGKKAEPVLDEKKAGDEEIPLVGLCTGSTATAVVFTDEMIYVASVGDSGCIAFENQKLRILSYGNFPHTEIEKERILKSGHSIRYNRIDGVLNMSRAFGDFTFKDKKNLTQKEQAVIAEPTISAIPTKDIDFVVIATDGVWNEMNVFSMSQFVANSLYLPTEEIIAEAFERVFLKRGYDNLSLIIIKNDKRCENFPCFAEDGIKELAENFRRTMERETREEEYKRMQKKKAEEEKSKMKEDENKKAETSKSKARKTEGNSMKVKKLKK